MGEEKQMHIAYWNSPFILNVYSSFLWLENCTSHAIGLQKQKTSCWHIALKALTLTHSNSSFLERVWIWRSAQFRIFDVKFFFWYLNTTLTEVWWKILRFTYKIWKYIITVPKQTFASCYTHCFCICMRVWKIVIIH